MSIKTQVNVSVAASTNGMGAGLTSTGASYVITAPGANDGLAHQITIKNNSATDHSAKTALITGTNENGTTLTETRAMPAGSATVTSVNYFRTVTSIVPSASTGADTFDIGWTLASVAPWFVPNLLVPAFNVGIGCTVASGSPTYSVQYTYDGSAWFTHATITGKTTSFDGSVTTPCVAIRLTFAAAGGVNMTTAQTMLY